MGNTLTQLVDHSRIVAIDEAALPAWPKATDRRELWFVNCHYHVSMSVTAAAQLVHEAKEDALVILRRLAERPSIRDYASVVVTIYVHIPVAGAERPARRRAYRVEIRSCDLPTQGSHLTQESLVRLPIYENSELDGVAELLHTSH
jgi:hypothetical protein